MRLVAKLQDWIQSISKFRIMDSSPSSYSSEGGDLLGFLAAWLQEETKMKRARTLDGIQDVG